MGSVPETVLPENPEGEDLPTGDCRFIDRDCFGLGSVIGQRKIAKEPSRVTISNYSYQSHAGDLQPLLMPVSSLFCILFR